MNRACRALLRRRAACGGFTLLEMLIVVAALAATAALAFAAVGNRDDQLRFDLTQQRLQALRSAMIGPALDAGTGLAGFAADNGALPGSIEELLSSTRDAFAARAPVFDKLPDGDGLDAGSDTVALTTHPLLKGYRGPYIDLAPGSSVYRDGWSNGNGIDDPSDASFDPNHGWAFTAFSATGPLRVASLGRNGLLDATAPAEPFDVDADIGIADADWRTDIVGGLAVRLRGKAGWFSVSLLVYDNTGTSSNPTGRWRRYSTAPLPIASLSTPSTCGQLSNGQGYLDGTAECTVTLTFPAGGGYGSPGIDTRVPYGRHMLVLVDNTGAAYSYTVSSVTTYVAAPVDFHRRSVPATVTLEVPA